MIWINFKIIKKKIGENLLNPDRPVTCPGVIFV